MIICCVFSGNGTYAYAEASYPRQLNDTARLISPTLQSNTRPGTCISFWYHMYGADINSLNVYTKVGGSLGTAIWQKKGNQANAWKYGQVFVRQPLNYQVSEWYSMFSFYIQVVLTSDMILSYANGLHHKFFKSSFQQNSCINIYIITSPGIFVLHCSLYIP